MKIELDINPFEADIVADALKLYGQQVESLWSGAILKHFYEQKEKALEIDYPHLAKENKI